MEKDMAGFITDPSDFLFWIWWLFFPITIPVTVIWWLVDSVF